MMKDFYTDFHPHVQDVAKNADREVGEEKAASSGVFDIGVPLGGEERSEVD